MTSTARGRLHRGIAANLRGAVPGMKCQFSVLLRGGGAVVVGGAAGRMAPAAGPWRARRPPGPEGPAMAGRSALCPDPRARHRRTMSGVRRRGLALPQRMRNRIRGLWPDHNALRRTSDRVEGAVLAGLLAAFLTGAPLAALAAGHWAAAAGARAAQAQQETRHQVSAVLLTDAPYQAYGWSGTVAKARWTAHDGSQHTGQVSAPMGAKRGATVQIWTDRAGKAIGPPLRPEQVNSQARLAAVIAPVALGFLLLVAGALMHQVLERRRLAAWAADWRVTGPQWSHQR